ncbi:MAG: hypothetical protein AAGD14_06030 [Planctomycetota bacterium]
MLWLLMHQRPERQGTDPLIPILGSAVSLVVLGAVLLVFYPRISAWMEVDRGPVVQSLPPVAEEIPLWTCRTEKGVALLIEPLTIDAENTDPVLDGMLEGGPYRYYRLSVYNFDRAEPFVLEVPAAGFASPEGGDPLRPAAARVRADLDAQQRTILLGLGATASVTVEQGHRGQILLVAPASMDARTAFVDGAQRYDRRSLPRLQLAHWHASPRWELFLDF